MGEGPDGEGEVVPSDGLLHDRLVQSLSDVRREDEGKEGVRVAHRAQRRRRLLEESPWLASRGWRALAGFAESSEVNVRDIRPILVPVLGPGRNADLFRLACLLWSVPVSKGYGRRMRFLVIDEANQKLIGLFALGDPVFNLTVRDRWIGWDVQARRQRIASVMDLYVCGAVPPYTELLGGKLIASLATSSEVSTAFRERYEGRQGIISGEVKPAKLLMITTTSALGRSSVYNRLKLDTVPPVRFSPLGHTEGWGHFGVSDALFRDLRTYLGSAGHKYADGHQYGTGPNWRLRTIRAAMDTLGIDGDLLRHGIRRQVFAAEMAVDARAQLREGFSHVTSARPTAQAIAAAALDRWILPRYERSGLQHWSRLDLRTAIECLPD